jgi:hypothetical protein
VDTLMLKVAQLPAPQQFARYPLEIRSEKRQQDRWCFPNPEPKRGL